MSQQKIYLFAIIFSLLSVVAVVYGAYSVKQEYYLESTKAESFYKDTEKLYTLKKKYSNRAYTKKVISTLEKRFPSLEIERKDQKNIGFYASNNREKLDAFLAYILSSSLQLSSLEIEKDENMLTIRFEAK